MREELTAIRQRFSREGRLEWIGLRPAHRQPVVSVNEVEAEAGKGLSGDRAGARMHSKRQVTLVQAEHLAVIACLLGVETVVPELLRRNLLVSSINVAALENKEFTVGLVVLRGTGICHPCARMEEALGAGGYNAVRGHGGITARVLSGGVLRIGDPVRFEIDDQAHE